MSSINRFHGLVAWAAFSHPIAGCNTGINAGAGSTGAGGETGSTSSASTQSAASSGASSSSGGGPGNGWSLVWSDEFDGTAIDASKWEHEVNCWGGGNNEQ